MNELMLVITIYVAHTENYCNSTIKNLNHLLYLGYLSVMIYVHICNRSITWDSWSMVLNNSEIAAQYKINDVLLLHISLLLKMPKVHVNVAVMLKSF